MFSVQIPQLIVEKWLFELTLLPQKTHGIQRQVSPDPRQHWGFAHTLSILSRRISSAGTTQTGVTRQHEYAHKRKTLEETQNGNWIDQDSPHPSHGGKTRAHQQAGRHLLRHTRR